MLFKNDPRYGNDSKTNDEFVKDLRIKIEEGTSKTSGIRVFEYEDDRALDDHEKKIIENLRKAHEEWQVKNE